MAEIVSVQEAVARIGRRDSMGLPLGTGQPPGFLRALGERDDWEDLRIAGALLTVGTELFTRPGNASRTNASAGRCAASACNCPAAVP